MIVEAYKIEIKGLVQGVGFRPFVYKLAKRHAICGNVENNNEGVLIQAEGNRDHLQQFIKAMKAEAPVASKIAAINVKVKPIVGFENFSILPSHSYSDEITEVSPDIAVCDDCLEDMKSQTHRIDYPFTNCTHCGPRFSIIKELPYDRHNTTMAPFKMCDTCHSEYTDVSDRRFHAQPVACNHCGPVYSLHLSNGEIFDDFETILEKVVCLLDEGKILAMKGLGGFHLSCDAFNEDIIRLLRLKKNREGKPLAVMFADVETVKNYLHVNQEEKKLLQSWRRPIVLLREKKPMPFSISNGLNAVGAMLPYMPFHYQLFEKLQTSALIMTSGNLSDEPVIIDNKKALEEFAGIADAVLTYNRKIHNRVDDSVCMVVNGKERVIRRSRAYVPASITLNHNTEGIFAAGAELVNCFAIGKGNKVLLSQYIGDLKNPETLDFYAESFQRFRQLFRFKPTLAAADLHPDYFSTKFAMETEIPVELIQHHHAHIASCMAEHNLDERVIGVSFDGTGLGTDGKIWGGEFLICDLTDFERPFHFENILQPGGDLTIRQPWRMAASCLYHYFGEDFLRKMHGKLFPYVEQEAFDMVLVMLKNRINCPETSSAGRLFDAVSALTGVCTEASYHAEAPMRLESVAAENVRDRYPFAIQEGQISFKPMFAGLIEDLENGKPLSVISAKFHNTVVEVIEKAVEKLSATTGLKKVVLSGGSFQNKILLKNTEILLRKKGFEVYSHEQVPSNDGGIALGQLAIAARRRETGKIVKTRSKQQ